MKFPGPVVWPGARLFQGCVLCRDPSVALRPFGLERKIVATAVTTALARVTRKEKERLWAAPEANPLTPGDFHGEFGPLFVASTFVREVADRNFQDAWLLVDPTMRLCRAQAWIYNNVDHLVPTSTLTSATCSPNTSSRARPPRMPSGMRLSGRSAPSTCWLLGTSTMTGGGGHIGSESLDPDTRSSWRARFRQMPQTASASTNRRSLQSRSTYS